MLTLRLIWNRILAQFCLQASFR